MLQKLIDKLINHFLQTKYQRIGLVSALVGLLFGGVLIAYLDNYDESAIVLIPLGMFLAGVYFMYLHKAVDNFINSDKGIQLNLPTDIFSKTSTNIKIFTSSKLFHYIFICVLAFLYAYSREVWVGNFDINKHKLDIFIAGLFGAVAVLGGIPVLFGKYVSIASAYVVFIMLITFNAFDAAAEKEENRLRAIQQSSIDSYKLKIGKLNGICEVRSAISSNTCKAAFKSNSEVDAICAAGIIALIPESYASNIKGYLSSQSVMSDVKLAIATLDSVISRGEYTPSTSETMALSARTGSVKHKVESDCKVFEAKTSELALSLIGEIKEESKHLLDAKVILK